MQFGTRQSIKKKKLYELIAEKIKEKIITQEFKINEKLPSERFLAEYFNVSVGTIRNALNDLSSMGLVRVDHGRGAFVAGTSFNKYIKLIGENIEIQLMKEDDLLIQLIETRIIIECQVAALAAKRRSEKDLQFLQSILKKGEKYIKEKDLSYFNKIDLEFHNTIAKSSNNCVIFSLMKAISRPLMRSLIKIHPYLNTIESSHIDHLLIFKCIQNKDSDGAIKAMKKHLNFAKDYLLNFRTKINGEKP
jgi:GntR family transcriptional repressor for pyruvate dehydrogenase complex